MASKTKVDIESIVTRLEATSQGTDFLRSVWESKWPGMHFYLANRSEFRGRRDIGGEATFKKAQGYEQLSDDPQVVGHPDFVLMGIPEEAYQEYLTRKRERSEKGMLPSDPKNMEQNLERRESTLGSEIAGLEG